VRKKGKGACGKKTSFKNKSNHFDSLGGKKKSLTRGVFEHTRRLKCASWGVCVNACGERDTGLTIRVSAERVGEGGIALTGPVFSEGERERGGGNGTR